MYRLIKFSLVSLVVSLFWSMTASAASDAFYWWASSDGNWTTPSNWSTSASSYNPFTDTYPGDPSRSSSNSDDVYFAGYGSGNCTLNQSVDIDAFNMNAGNTSTIFVSGADFNVSARVFLRNGTLDLSSATSSLVWDDLYIYGNSTGSSGIVFPSVTMTVDSFTIGNNSVGPDVVDFGDADLEVSGIFRFYMPSGSSVDLSDLSSLAAKKIQLDGAGTVNMPSDFDVSVGYWDRNSSNVVVNAGNGTVVLDYDYDNQTYGLSDNVTHFNNLIVDKPDGSYRLNFDTDLYVDGEFEVKQGTVYVDSGVDIYVGELFKMGNYSGKTVNYGTTVRFSLEMMQGMGVSSSTCPSGASNPCYLQYVDGDLDLVNFTKVLSSPTNSEVLYFGADVGDSILVDGLTTITGDASYLVYLRSESDGNQWEFSPDGTLDLSYLNVRDSNNVSLENTPIPTDGFNIANGGNNTNWAFASGPDDPSNLGPNYYIDGSSTTDTTPTFNFDLSVESGTVRYNIKVYDTTAAANTLKIDYTSDLAASGTRAFTVGQAAGGGSYALGADITELLEGEYTWEVMAISDTALESAVVSAAASDAFVVDLTAPEAVDNTYPVGGELISESQPTFTWEDLDDEESYTLQISDDPTFTIVDYEITDIAQNSTSVAAPAVLGDGAHYWRIWGIDDVGNEDSGAATIENFYTGVHAANDPVIVGMNQFINGGNTAATKPSLRFQLTDIAPGATVKYHLQLDDDSDFSSPLIEYVSALGGQNGGATYTTFYGAQDPAGGVYLAGSDLENLSNGAYYWRVKAINNVDGESAWVKPQAEGVVDFYVDTSPDDPSNLGPATMVTNAYTTSANVVLTFYTSSSGNNVLLSHNIQIATDEAFSNIVVDYSSAYEIEGNRSFDLGQAAGTGTYNVGAENQVLADGTYYWRANVINESLVSSSYSNASSGAPAFVINSETPNNPINLDSEDIDDETQQVTTKNPELQFELHSSTPDLPLGYQIQIDDNDDFSSPKIDYTSGKSDQGLRTFTVGQGGGTYVTGADANVLYDGLYYWRVKAYNNPESDWSDGGSFEVTGQGDEPTGGDGGDDDGGPTYVPEFSDYLLILTMFVSFMLIVFKRRELGL